MAKIKQEKTMEAALLKTERTSATSYEILKETDRLARIYAEEYVKKISK